MVGQAHKLVADDLVRKAQRPLQTFEVSAVGGDLPDDVDALCLVVDLVGEPAATPPIGGGDGSASGRDLRRDRLDLLVDHEIIDARVAYDLPLLSPHGGIPPLLYPATPGTPTRGQGGALDGSCYR